jgi:O-antigen ligase
VQFIGYPTTLRYVYPYIGIGSHNDFLRVLFATGVLGLLFYLVFLWRIFNRLFLLPAPQQFLLLGTLIAIVFYSISVTPTFYAPFMYFALSIFAYSALPENKRLLWSDRPY